MSCDICCLWHDITPFWFLIPEPTMPQNLHWFELTLSFNLHVQYNNYLQQWTWFHYLWPCSLEVSSSRIRSWATECTKRSSHLHVDGWMDRRMLHAMTIPLSVLLECGRADGSWHRKGVPIVWCCGSFHLGISLSWLKKLQRSKVQPLMCFLHSKTYLEPHYPHNKN